MISAIGSDVATWQPPPPSYDMHGRTHGSGLVSLSRHRKEWMGRPQGRPYAAKERLRRWVMEKIGAPGFAAARYSSGLQGTVNSTVARGRSSKGTERRFATQSAERCVITETTENEVARRTTR